MSQMPPRRRLMTAAERAYMLDAALGLSAKQSAKKQGVSVNTVNTMLKRAKFVLGAINITHAAALAVANGEIRPNELRDPE